MAKNQVTQSDHISLEDMVIFWTGHFENLFQSESSAFAQKQLFAVLDSKHQNADLDVYDTAARCILVLRLAYVVPSLPLKLIQSAAEMLRTLQTSSHELGSQCDREIKLWLEFFVILQNIREGRWQEGLVLLTSLIEKAQGVLLATAEYVFNNLVAEHGNLDNQFFEMSENAQTWFHKRHYGKFLLVRKLDKNIHNPMLQDVFQPDELTFFRSLQKLQSVSDLHHLALSLQSNISYRKPYPFLLIWLMAKAHDQIQTIDALPKLNTIRRYDPEALKVGGGYHHLFDCVRSLEAMLRSQSANESQLHLSNCLTSMLCVTDSTAKDLIIRSLFSHPKLISEKDKIITQFYDMCNISLRNCYKLKRSNVLTLPLEVLEPSKKEVSIMPVSYAKRMSAFTNLGARILATKLKYYTKLFLSRNNNTNLWQEQSDQIISQINRYVGTLRGPAMKTIQLVIQFSGKVDDSSLNGLSDVFYGGQYVAHHHLTEAFTAQLGSTPEETFVEWDNDIISGASIGQVYKAYLPGRVGVAVKIKYPGMEQIIKNDYALGQYSRIFVSAIFPRIDFDTVQSEFLRLTLQECDYEYEAKMLLVAREFSLSYDSSIVIPKVYDKFTRSGVLVTEHIRGLNFNDYIKSADIEDRSASSSEILRFLMNLFFETGLLNGDLHPGNLLFLPNGKICILDFGFSEVLSESRRDLYADLIIAVIERNYVQFEKLALEMGFTTGDAGFDFTTAGDRLHAYLTRGFDVAEVLDAHWIKDLATTFTVSAANRKNISLPKEDIVPLRFFMSLLGLFIQMESKIRFGREIYEAAKKYKSGKKVYSRLSKMQGTS